MSSHIGSEVNMDCGLVRVRHLMSKGLAVIMGCIQVRK